MTRSVVLLVAVVSIAAGAVLGRAQVSQPGFTYPIWEYRTEVMRGPTTQEMAESTLDGLGRQGWELAGMTRREVRVQDVIQTETAFVFKRSRGEARR